MTTQKEIDEAFIATLEGILNICDKTTSGNVSHNIATIKGKCRNMLQFYEEFPVSPWHSVADGDLPKLDTVVLINTKEYGVITARYDKRVGRSRSSFVLFGRLCEDC